MTVVVGQYLRKGIVALVGSYCLPTKVFTNDRIQVIIFGIQLPETNMAM
jgi:hypothetical protein